MRDIKDGKLLYTAQEVQDLLDKVKRTDNSENSIASSKSYVRHKCVPIFAQDGTTYRVRRKRKTSIKIKLPPHRDEELSLDNIFIVLPEGVQNFISPKGGRVISFADLFLNGFAMIETHKKDLYDYAPPKFSRLRHSLYWDSRNPMYDAINGLGQVYGGVSWITLDMPEFLDGYVTIKEKDGSKFFILHSETSLSERVIPAPSLSDIKWLIEAGDFISKQVCGLIELQIYRRKKHTFFLKNAIDEEICYGRTYYVRKWSSYESRLNKKGKGQFRLRRVTRNGYYKSPWVYFRLTTMDGGINQIIGKSADCYKDFEILRFYSERGFTVRQNRYDGRH